MFLCNACMLHKTVCVIKVNKQEQQEHRLQQTKCHPRNMEMRGSERCDKEQLMAHSKQGKQMVIIDLDSSSVRIETRKALAFCV